MRVSYLKLGDSLTVASGSILTIPGKPVHIELSGNKTGAEKIQFKFNFRTDSKNQEQKVDAKLISSQELHFTFVNFDNPLGTGSKVPIPLGTLDGLRLSFMYRVYSLEQGGTKLFVYTFFTDKEVKK